MQRYELIAETIKSWSTASAIIWHTDKHLGLITTLFCTWQSWVPNISRESIDWRTDGRYHVHYIPALCSMNTRSDGNPSVKIEGGGGQQCYLSIVKISVIFWCRPQEILVIGSKCSFFTISHYTLMSPRDRFKTEEMFTLSGLCMFCDCH